MNIYYLLGGSIVFLAINYIISSTDIINPSFVFCAVNFVYSAICCLYHNLFGNNISISTVIVMTAGMLIFTFSNIIYTKSNKGKLLKVSYTCKAVIVNKRLIYFILVLMTITAFITCRHIINIAADYGGEGSLSKSVGIFDNILKFKNEGVAFPPIYSLLLSPIKATAYIFAAVLVNNFFATKKIDKHLAIYCICYLPFSLISGARSEIVRYLMSFMVDIIIIQRRVAGTFKKGNIRALFKAVIFAVAIVALSFPLLFLIGKSSVMHTNTPIVMFLKYVGGPVYNFDSELTRGIARSNLFGQETFQGIYSLLAKLLRVDEFNYRVNIPTSFINGTNFGNVYTMYFMFFEDFGLLGMILVIPICVYYFRSYGKLMNFSKDQSPLSINLFVYSYMFNSLVMLLFSNRFYEIMFSYNFIKLLLSFYFIWFAIRKIRFKSHRIGERVSD